MNKRTSIWWNDELVTQAVQQSRSITELLAKLNGSWQTAKKHIQRLGLSTKHFDPVAAAQSKRVVYHT